MRSVRHYWRGFQGRVPFNFNWDAINADSTVFVTASEWREDPESPTASPRIVGDATITARNIVPHGPPEDPNNGVTFVLTIDSETPLDVVTDIVLVEPDEPPVVQHPPLLWVRLMFSMQTQLQTNWCWCATTVTVSNFYGDALTQCDFANRHWGRTDCCGAGGAGACNIASDMVSSLREVGHLNTWKKSPPTFADIKTEVDGGRPTTLRVQWNGGGGHFIAATGYLSGSTTWVAVDDPFHGPSDILLNTLLTSYQSSGTIDETHFTKA